MPNYADDFARFLQAWPSQPDAVPALNDPLAIYPWARGLQPFLVPMSHQQSTPWFDPARQANLVPLDDNPLAQAAPTVAREVATPPSPPWILAPVHHDPFQGLPTLPYLVPLPAGFNPFAGGAAAFKPSASNNQGSGAATDPATSGADAPWWFSQFNSAAPVGSDARLQQPGALRTFGTAAAQSAVTGTGQTLRYLGVTAGQSNRRLLDRMDRIDRGEQVRPIDDVIGYQDMSPEQRQAFRADWNERLARPIEDNPAYRVGQAVERYGQDTFPLTAEQRDSWSGRTGDFAGGLLPATAIAGVGSLFGMPEAGFLAAAAQSGMQTGGATFDDAMAKGASEETAAKAAGLSALMNGGLGAIKLGNVLAPVRATAPGLLGWTAARLEQAVRSGATFATLGEAQAYLGQQIANAYYDPDATYSPDVERIIGNAIGGGLLGLLTRNRGEAPDLQKGQFSMTTSSALANETSAKTCIQE